MCMVWEKCGMSLRAIGELFGGMKEKMDGIVHQIEHGDYDTALTREPW